MQPLLVYIHGFNSSPQSVKARLMTTWLKQQDSLCDYWVPELPVDSIRACNLLLERLQEELKSRPVYLVGSSLGGFYASWLQQQLLPKRVKIALVNPAVRPWELLHDYLGEQQNLYTGECYTLTPDHVDHLKQLDSEPDNREDTLLLLQTGDKTLDYRKAKVKYQGCPALIEEGGSHGFDNFEGVIPTIIEFFGLRP